MLFLKNINNREYRNNTALYLNKNEIYTYRKLIDLIDRFSLQIKKRILVFFLCNNNIESIIGYLGFIKSNCVISLIDPKIDKKILINLIEIYQPDFIYLEKKKFTNIKNFTLFSSFGDYLLLKIKKEIKKIIHDDLALLISTSGSTGSPKLVRQSYLNLISNTNSISKYLKITERDIAITTLPMSYVYGLSIINTHMNQGAALVLNTSSLVEKDFWNKMQSFNVTNFGGVPYTYSILEKIDFKKYNLKSLRYTTQAGGKINKKTLINILKNYNLLGIKMFLMYGATEATARMSYIELKKKNMDKIESIGKPIPGGKFYLKDSKSKLIKKNNISGELIYSGKNVCLGYAEKLEDLSKGDRNKGILKTGDIAFRDSKNFYYIIGRKDRYVKIYGVRLNLQELEDIIEKYGLENMCTLQKENTINILIKKNVRIDRLKRYIFSIVKIHPSIIRVKIVKEFPLSKNLKFLNKNKYETR